MRRVTAAKCSLFKKFVHWSKSLFIGQNVCSLVKTFVHCSKSLFIGQTITIQRHCFSVVYGQTIGYVKKNGAQGLKHRTLGVGYVGGGGKREVNNLLTLVEIEPVCDVCRPHLYEVEVQSIIPGRVYVSMGSITQHSHSNSHSNSHALMYFRGGH